LNLELYISEMRDLDFHESNPLHLNKDTMVW
jgi:hypothetical protein